MKLNTVTNLGPSSGGGLHEEEKEVKISKLLRSSQKAVEALETQEPGTVIKGWLRQLRKETNSDPLETMRAAVDLGAGLSALTKSELKEAVSFSMRFVANSVKSRAGYGASRGTHQQSATERLKNQSNQTK